MIRQILKEAEDNRLELELQQIWAEQERKKQALIAENRVLYGNKDFTGHGILSNEASLSDLKYKESQNAKSKPHKLVKCSVCGSNKGEYTCPRCKISYWTSEWYKKHSDKCTEVFYESCVKNELKQQRANPDSIKNMKDILKRHKADLEQDTPQMSVKFANFTNEEVLGKLDSLTLDDFTPQEREDFNEYIRTLRNNGAEVQLKEWIPWWISYEEIDESGDVTNSTSAFVEEVQTDQFQAQALMSVNMNRFILYDDIEQEKEEKEDNGEEDEIEGVDPEENPIAHAFKILIDELEDTENSDNLKEGQITVQIDKNSDQQTDKNDIVEYNFSYWDKAKLLKLRYNKIKPLKSITKKEPSDLLKYHILDTLFWLLFYYRLHNGDVLTNPPEFDFDNWKQIKDPKLLYDFKYYNLYRDNAKISIEKATERLVKFETYSLVMQYKPIIIEDLKWLLDWSKLANPSLFYILPNIENTNLKATAKTSAKFNTIEAIFRLYDLVHYIETDLKNLKNLYNRNTTKVNTWVKQRVFEISKFKHKLIYYLSYLKEQDDLFFETLAKEIEISLRIDE